MSKIGGVPSSLVADAVVASRSLSASNYQRTANGHVSVVLALSNQYARPRFSGLDVVDRQALEA